VNKFNKTGGDLLNSPPNQSTFTYLLLLNLMANKCHNSSSYNNNNNNNQQQQSTTTTP